jgi:hypothetical protein
MAAFELARLKSGTTRIELFDELNNGSSVRKADDQM